MKKRRSCACAVSALAIAAAWAALARAASAAVVEATRAEELLVLRGDQSGATIRVAPGYLPSAWNVATAIYARGRPKFVLPPDYRATDDGDGWWTVTRRREPRVCTWTGAAKDGKWASPANWRPSVVPGRLDSARFTTEATVDLGRDRMVSNIVFTAKVILAKGAVHARNTLGRGARAKLGVRAGSCLGKVRVDAGASVMPLRGMAGYAGVLQVDAEGDTRVVLTRPSAAYVWTGAAKDGKWTTLANWLVAGRRPVEPPCEQDMVVFPADGAQAAKVELPRGQTVVSNLVLQAAVEWHGPPRGDILGGGGGCSFDICDLAGNESLVLRGAGVTICLRCATLSPVTVGGGMTLALSRHGHQTYGAITLEKGASLVPYDWVVEIQRLVAADGSTILFWPPRHFNKWRPLWMMHIQSLEGAPVIQSDDMAHWQPGVERWNDGSSMVTIGWRD